MPVQDWLQHKAEVVRWKADQQARIFRVQGQIRDLENQIRNQKAALADRTILLFNQSQLTEPELVQICAAIGELKASIAQKQVEQEAINQEQPPQAPDTTYDPNVPASGLKCPVDGKLLAGRFCPEHGVEGIPIDSATSSASNSKEGIGAVQLVCPVCRKTLNGRFCPEHGAEGVPAN